MRPPHPLLTLWAALLLSLSTVNLSATFARLHGKTARLAGLMQDSSRMQSELMGSFEDLPQLPGKMEVAAAKLTSTGDSLEQMGAALAEMIGLTRQISRHVASITDSTVTIRKAIEQFQDKLGLFGQATQELNASNREMVAKLEKLSDTGDRLVGALEDLNKQLKRPNIQNMLRSLIQ